MSDRMSSFARLTGICEHDATVFGAVYVAIDDVVAVEELAAMSGQTKHTRVHVATGNTYYVVRESAAVVMKRMLEVAP